MTASTEGTSPFLYFLAGALIPSLAWFFLGSKNDESNNLAEAFDDDEDTADASTGGPSSKWGYTDAPYKVRIVMDVL